jgi:hypothetical protein
MGGGMDETSERIRRDQARGARNQEFFRRLIARRPQTRQRYERMLAQPESVPEALMESAATVEAAGLPRPDPSNLVLETIVNEERPVLFVRDDWLDRNNVTAIGEEAEELIRDLDARRDKLQPLMPLIGRIDVTDFPGSDYVGSGWVVDTNIVVTNRHVASLIARRDGRKFAFRRGVAGKPMTSSFNSLHEFDDLEVGSERAFAVEEVLYIEPESGPDIAFLRIARRTDGSRADRIAIAPTDVGENVRVVVVGYPARAPRRVIPDQELMKRLYRDRYDVKRAAPGFTMGPEQGSTSHDCTTLGGNSGSVVLDMKTGEAVGLHFAGLYQEANYAVRASILSQYVSGKRWNSPIVIGAPESGSRRPAMTKPKYQRQAAIFGDRVDPPPPPPPPRSGVIAAQGVAGAAGAVTITMPLSITVSLGLPAAGAALPGGAGLSAPASGGGRVHPAPADPAQAEAAVRAFWDERPEGVIAARVGYAEADDDIGDEVFIAASVPPEELEAVASRGPQEFRGFAVRYLPANVTEQIDSEALVEAIDRISYDDSARTGEGFSFEPVEERMLVRAHVGPEYSWDELESFIGGANGRMVSGIYEFHGSHVRDAIEKRLKEGASLTMVLDNVSFSDVKHEDEEFDRIPVFKRWKTKFKERFERVVAPEGAAGLIANAYHIKVTVREDDTIWLSSGNWKMGSSQPMITDEERENAAEEDLPGNREWHVIVKNRTLARRFRNHLLQDFKHSRTLGGGDVPPSKEATDIFVDVPIEEGLILERRPASRLLKPQEFNGTIKVKPLLTPDHEGEVYSEAVLDLINSARESLWFQIPYIGMPSNPRADRGFIDELIKALTQKLKTLDDARVLLRSGGSKFSSPTHAAWFFKSKGVKISERLRLIEDHHTKGMIVDRKRVLIGSHNWSQPGVTLNRDASLIFDDEGIADYFAQAFEIDWDRANPIKPKRFVKPEGVIREAVGVAPPVGYRRVRLSELLKEDD